MAIPKLQCTKNYGLFKRSDRNRVIDQKKHKRLRKSMEQYGFIPSYPISCSRNGDQHLIVIDGQHRLLFAETLGLPVYYIVEEISFDVPSVNSTPVIWKPRDFAETFAAQGKQEYQHGLEFTDRYRLPVCMAFAILAGTSNFGNISEGFYAGTFKTKELQYAERVGNIYAKITALAKRLRNARLLEACMAVCRVKEFDPQRLMSGAERCRERLVPYSTRDAYLDMLESIYNYGRKQLVPLKISAVNAMRERNPRNGKRGVTTA